MYYLCAAIAAGSTTKNVRYSLPPNAPPSNIRTQFHTTELEAQLSKRMLPITEYFSWSFKVTRSCSK